MYTAIPTGTIANGARIGMPLAIRAREAEIVLPLKVAYVFIGFATGAARVVSFAISRSKLHQSQPPTRSEMLLGGPVFFGVTEIRKSVETQVGIDVSVFRVEVDLRGVKVAGELTACFANGSGADQLARFEFFYEIARVSRVEKAALIWRGETAEQPN